MFEVCSNYEVCVIQSKNSIGYHYLYEMYIYRRAAGQGFTIKSSNSMVITYVYARNSAPWADWGFLNDVQNMH